MSIKSIQDQIKKNGKLSGGNNYWQSSESLYGKTKNVIPVMKPMKNPPNAAFKLEPTGSKSVVIGDPPEGFGKGFIWDRKDNQILLGLFVNAADPFGISIDGLDRGDIIQVTSATGIASFTEDEGNPLAASLVGLLASGAEVGLTIAGVPEAVPLVGAANKFAQDQFKPTHAKHKKRTAFGVDPDSGHKAKQEGGILVCLPEAGGTFYSGDGDHRERWIKEPGDREDKNRPKDMSGAFFPIQGNTRHNTRQVTIPGQAYVLAWDHIFEDNAGFYEVFVHVTKGSIPEPGPVR